MKTIKIYLLALATLLVTGCTKAFDNISDAQDVERISVDFHLTMGVDDLKNSKLKLHLKNNKEGINYTFPKEEGQYISGGTVTAKDIIPGVYSINISGDGIDNEDVEYLMNGNLVNQPLLKNQEKFDVKVKGIMLAALIFKEIYYAGVPNWFFQDQFYELYNNSSNVIYLDGIYFANIVPGNAGASEPMTWPDGKDDYVYAERVWKFPGKGTDYPLQPGESVILAQSARNHQITNANSPVDLTSAEFEFYTGGSVHPDMDAIDMDHVFYDGKASMGSLTWFMTPVFGPAMIVFKETEGETWDPVNDPNCHSMELGTTSSTLYAKIPIEYVWDAVETLNNSSIADKKRVPGLLDAGLISVDGMYVGKSVARKIDTDEAGNPKTLENGAYIYKDTNNSTDDFEVVVPEIRRKGAKMPSWNHTLQN